MIWYEFIKFFFEQQHNFHLWFLKSHYYITPKIAKTREKIAKSGDPVWATDRALTYFSLDYSSYSLNRLATFAWTLFE